MTGSPPVEAATPGRPVAARRPARLLALIVAAGLGAWLMLSLLAWLTVPPLFRWQVETRLASALGRTVVIGDVRFDPWRLDLVVRDLRVGGSPRGDRRKAAAASAEPLLTIGRLHVDLAASSLVERAPIIEALEVDALRLRVARLAVGAYDVDDVLRKLVTPAVGAAPASPPIRFALHNVLIRDGAVRFDDRPAARVHELTALEVAVPSISALPKQVESKVSPRLSFRLNGVPFQSDGVTTPFAATRSGEIHVAVQGLDLAPFRPYLPSSLPFDLVGGRLSTTLYVAFSVPPDGHPAVAVRGTAAVDDARVLTADGQSLAAWRRLELDIRRAEPLARRVALASVRVDGVDANLRRAVDAGVLRPPAAAPPRTASAPARATLAGADPGTTPDPWQIEIDRVDVADSTVAWNDTTVSPRVALRIAGLDAHADRLRWPPAQPIAFSARASLSGPGKAAAPAGAVTLRGSASATTADVRVSLVGLPLDAFDGYWAQGLRPKLRGSASAEARVEWSADDPAGGRTRVKIDSAALDASALQVDGADRSPASIARLSLNGATLDTETRALSVERLVIDAPTLTTARDKDGRIDLAQWFVAAPAPAATGLAPWRFEIAQTLLTGGRLEWTDERVARGASAVRLALVDLRVALQKIAWQGDHPAVPAHFEASGRVGTPLARGETESRNSGVFAWRGVVGVAPLEMIGQLKAERLPLHLLMPYAGTPLPVRIEHAEFGIDGQLSVRQLASGVDVDAGADLLLGAVQIDSRSGTPGAAAGETLLRWNTLTAKNVRLAVKPGARPLLDVGQATLADFYSRLVVTEDGRLNVLALGAGAAPSDAATPLKATAAGAPSRSPIDIRVGETVLSNGRIDFSDHFVRPNYSAALTGLDGRLGTLDTANPRMAALSLRGRAAGTAQVEIDGTVDPLARPPALDLHARATDLELAPLSPYAGKYAGYAIERGKLSMDVAYKLGADGRLEASNRVVLNQLTFGNRIESPAATTLPVLFAVSLLKDRNGVIDLDLPIRGSLNDPQFSVAALIGRLLGNLLMKAVTSPFSLLTRGAGGVGADAGDPARVAFVPGTARLAESGAAAVEIVAQALSTRPALLLTVTGTADASREQDAYRSARLEERIEAERRAETVAAADAASAPQPPLSASARERLVRRLYRESDLPDKPRNVLGLASNVPLADMETRLKAAISVTPDALRALALERGVGVREALIARGLSSDRLFLAAPRLDAAAADVAWQPEAQLALTPR